MMIALQRLHALVIAAAMVAEAAGASAQPPLPSAVDLTRYQSPVKDQGGRDTSGSFATLAALEAAYRRSLGVDLDLSEQFLNHWAQQFASAGSGRALPLSETVAGSSGGGGIGRPLLAFARGLAVPPEAALPYVTDPAYESAPQRGAPSLKDCDSLCTQRTINDFNLSDTPALYGSPKMTWAWTTVMPQTALDAARYRPTGASEFAAGEVNNVDAYRAVLAAGREVIVAFRCCDGRPAEASVQPWALPVGSNGGGKEHVMLIVGYDDGRKMFRVKSSWGIGWAERGYAWVSYDLIQRAAVGAASLQGAAPIAPGFDAAARRTLFLGRWQLTADRQKGVLDMYNLPEAPAPGEIRNHRIGTLFMADGRIHRVNGQIDGNALTIRVDLATPNLPASQLSGSTMTVWIRSRETRWMAGILRGTNGATYPVEAVKASLPVATALHHPPFQRSESLARAGPVCDDECSRPLK